VYSPPRGFDGVVPYSFTERQVRSARVVGNAQASARSAAQPSVMGTTSQTMWSEMQAGPLAATSPARPGTGCATPSFKYFYALRGTASSVSLSLRACCTPIPALTMACHRDTGPRPVQQVAVASHHSQPASWPMRLYHGTHSTARANGTLSWRARRSVAEMR
jgi:hypothetical protein